MRNAKFLPIATEYVGAHLANGALVFDHPDGAHHAGQLLGVNFPEFHNTNQFKRSGFSNQISLILEPVSMGLGFTVLPSHAVGAFNKPQHIKTHQLPNSVRESLYLGTHINGFKPNRVVTVITEVEKCLGSL